MNNYLSRDVKLTLVQAALADGSTDPASTSVDMAAEGGFDGVMFIAICGTITGSGTIEMHAEQSADDSTFNALTDATTTATSSTKSDKLLVVDVQKPVDRYVRVQLSRVVANSIVGGIIAMQYQAGTRPCVTAAAQLASAIVRVNGAAED